ncbi:Bax inhibitor-1/YccA family protein [Nesterenkonia flava]|uniref:Bax inhibitor-1/YccA family protein n=1 Tax=Nesterenkonia flava TaxID=469799 RepID=A0ABU1FQA8_9MICC|nr:Bax inhibitor-1/YccA family protein [Nesterenkonia flava]MDR5710820.1 Bax inhibitor-1/YccA family protein [Nesterenkonia flava]
MSNPIFNTGAFPDQFSEQKRERRRFYMNSDAGTVSEQPRQEQTYGQKYGMPGPQTGGQYGADRLEQQYNLPDAAGSEGAPMTYDDVIRKTVISFAVVLLGAGITVSLLGLTTPEQGINVGLGMTLTTVGLFGGLVLGLVNAFKRNPSPALILAYSLLQGFFVGGITSVLNWQFDGIAMQAVLATVSVFAAVLILFKSGKVRATPKLNKMFFVALLGYALFSLINLGLMLFGVTDSMFGLRTEVSPWLGIALGLLGLALATYSLVLDFTNIQEGVEAGVAEKYGWTAAFGLTVSLVWLYIEILRLLAIIRSMAD